MTASGGKLFFVVGDQRQIISYSSSTGIATVLNPPELWVTDGTAAGTMMLRHITTSSGNTLSSSSFGTGGSAALADVNGTLFFASDDGGTGSALWKTDGTTAGTVMVKAMPSICLGTLTCSPSPQIPASLTAVNGTLFFTGNAYSISMSPVASSGSLWKSDGTEVGTVEVKSDIGFFPTNLIDVNGALFFTASDANSGSGTALWKSDGTDTTQVASLGTASAQELTNVGGNLFFATVSGTPSAMTVKLWKSDGTMSGTAAVKDLCTAECSGGSSSSSMYAGPFYLTNVNGTLFFADGGALWRTDGTAEGTAELANTIYPEDLIGLGGALYFTATDITNGTELWRSDGTVAGTSLLKDVCPGPCSGILQPTLPALTLRTFSLPTVPVPTYISGFFSGSSVFGLPYSAAPKIFVSNGKLYFPGCDLVNQCEPWTSDGTSGGTRLLKNIAINTSSMITSAVNFKGALLFSGYDGTSMKLWRTDGTDAGTSSFKDVSGTLLPSAVTSGAAFFFSIDANNEFGLWKTDGTDAGTTMLKIFSRPDSTGVLRYSYPISTASVNDTLFFTEDDGVHGQELWKSDGTVNGTVMVKDIVPGSDSSEPLYLTAFNGLAFFSRFSLSDGTTSLWKSDGTDAGTVPVKTFVPLSGCLPTPTNSCQSALAPRYLTPVGSSLFFVVDDALWKTDGTPEGTVSIALPAISSNAYPSSLTDVNGTVFFWRGYQLWKSDGTDAGTVLVKDFTPTPTTPPGLPTGISSSLAMFYMGGMVNVNGTLFFTQGNALWKSDGTAAGTVMVKDIAASYLANVKGQLYFVANDTSNGTELWKSDGTDAGTLIVADLNPGVNGSWPNLLAISHGKLYFTANDGTHGTELWALDATPTTVEVASSAGPVLVSNSITFTATVKSTTTGTLTGSVRFMDGMILLGTSTVNGSGVATLTTTVLTAGTHNITAAYSGDESFANSTSAALIQVVLATAPDYTLSATPTSATIRAGQSATFVITATADTYFNGTVSFNCGTLPMGVTCSFSPTTLNPTSGNPKQTTLVVSTTAQTASAIAPQLPHRNGGTVLFATLAGSGVFGCLLLGKTSERRLIAALIPLALLALGLTSCGGSGVTRNPSGTPSGSTTVQVTATATAGTTSGSTAAHQLGITIIVQ